MLDLGCSRVIEIAFTEFILDEGSRILRAKFAWPKEAIAATREEIARFAQRVIPTRRIDAVRDDPTDNRILECAIAAGSEYLVTGDRHLLALVQFEDVRIVSPATFVKIQAARAKGSPQGRVVGGRTSAFPGPQKRGTGAPERLWFTQQPEIGATRPSRYPAYDAADRRLLEWRRGTAGRPRRRLPSGTTRIA